MVPPGSALVLIPAYNEEAQIGEVLAAIRATEPNADIAVIDDGSRDKTSEIARSAGAIVIQHPYNMGYGSALQTGYKYAIRRGGYDYVIQMDGDGQHEPKCISDLLAAVKDPNVDVVLGSRWLDKDAYKGSWQGKSLNALKHHINLVR